MIDFRPFLNKMIYVRTNTQDAYVHARLASINTTRLVFTLYSGAEHQVHIDNVLQIAESGIVCPAGRSWME